MSLKAKIEAVIYASEEPVTLAQLAGLLGQEAQAELDHLDSAQRSLALDELAEAEPAGGETEPAAAEPALTEPEPTEPEPTESAPTKEPEPTDESPGGEHPEAKADAAKADGPKETAAAAPSAKDEKARERRLREYFRSVLDELIADYASQANDRGLEVREVAGGFRLGTKPEYHDAVRGFVKSLKPPLKLSLQALETLAVVAYKQPVTAPEISEIRGVDSGGVLGSLLARKLVTTAGRKHVIGRPILYKTTRDFLLRFGLNDINELPSIEEFEKMAGELRDLEPVQEEIPMEHHAVESASELEQERDTVEAQADGDSSVLDPAPDSKDSPDTPEDHEPDTVATPEGDNEAAPDAPLAPAADGLQTPRGE
ncbi:MAG: SMC-Scp complex subunit ScpB [Acidobacteria bacterium]|nr:SMC-Scp complex subunit ScpB [Acidobacteriota bacterium]